MKLREHLADRKLDVLTIQSKFTDHMRRPRSVKLVLQPVEAGSMDNVLISGDIKDVKGTIDGIAEIAWAQGWRPRGLAGILARQVETFKIPPAE